jgi:hypothetical protein
MTWMSMRLLVWRPRGSRLTRVPGLEAWACPIMRSVPSCRATRHDFLCRQTTGVAEEVCLTAIGAVGLSFTRQSAQL